MRTVLRRVLRSPWWCANLAAIAVAAASTMTQLQRAQADDSSIAEQLFRDGKRLLAEGRTADACRSFEGSYRKQVAISTLLNLADCREKNGQYASAWASFVQADRATRDDPSQTAVNQVATTRARLLESRLSYLQIKVSTPSTDGLVILRDGILLDHAEWDSRIAVDSGEYVVEARAPGRETWRTTVRVGSERDWRVITVPELTLTSAPMSGPPVGTASRVGTIGTWTVIGGGSVVIASLVSGYLAKSKLDAAKALCGDDLRCETSSDRVAGQALVESARRRGTISTVLGGLGAVAVVTGVGVWFLARGRTAAPPPANESKIGLQVLPYGGADTLGVAISGEW